MNVKTLMLLALFLAACGSFPAPAPQHPLQLRLMTWNVAFLTIDATLFGVPPVEIELDLKGENFSNLDKTSRARRIADGVLRAGPDVVVFNEVFSEDARHELVLRLAPQYPHYVSWIGAEPPVEDVSLGVLDAFVDAVPPELSDYLVEPLDSGLMLFSRFPLLDLPVGTRNDALCSDTLCRLEGSSGGSSSIGGKVAFARYDVAGGLDQVASKGAALVQLDTPGQPTFVVFSHMQADEGAVFASERVAQYDTLRELVEDTLTEAEIRNRPIYVLGDLNTPGESAEWSHRFAPGFVLGNPFFACGNDRPCSPSQGGRILVDSWGFETSPTDPGETSAGGNRLDYVLRSVARTCTGHIRIPWEVADGGEVWYSDHKPVLADMNVASRWCSANREAPNLAHRPAEFTFGGTDCNPCQQDKSFGPADGAGIHYPGAYQWFVIDQAGSYSLAVSNGSVGFDVYHHTDLSRPHLPYDDEVGEWGLPYAMLSPPYYIRTFAVSDGEPDRTLAGLDYSLKAHQHLCREPEDACFLQPQEDVIYDWPDQSQGLADVMEIWYRFKTSGVRDGRLMPPSDGVLYPEVRFLHESAQGACLGDLALTEFDDPSFPNVVIGEPDFVGVETDPNDTDWDNDTQTDERWIAPNLGGKQTDDFAEYFVKIARSCTFSMRTTARLETTLTWFKPGRIRCRRQYDDSGVGEDDLVRFDFTFDKPGGGSTRPCEGACDFEFEFDEDWPSGWQVPGQHYLGGEPELSGYYVDAFYPNLFEDEGDADDPDARLEVLSVAGGSWTPAGLEPLDATVREVPMDTGSVRFADATEMDDADYWYEMNFLLNHTGPTHETP